MTHSLAVLLVDNRPVSVEVQHVVMLQTVQPGTQVRGQETKTKLPSDPCDRRCAFPGPLTGIFKQPHVLSVSRTTEGHV